MSHTINRNGSKPPKRGGYCAGDYGRLQGTEGMPLNREQRRAAARLERKKANRDGRR